MLITRSVTRCALVIAACLAGACAATAQPAVERASKLASDAVAAMDAGRVDHALRLLDSAIALDPGERWYTYEKAYAYHLKGDHARGIATLATVIDDTSATDLFFQLGSSLELGRGDTAAAEALLQRGLERFTRSGRLHLELGNIDLLAGRYHEAVAHYEAGMAAEPAFPSNYYRAALILARSSEPLWGIVYGEMFMNIERETPRTTEIGALLLETYRRAISAGGDSLFAVTFSTNTSATHLSGGGRPEDLLDAMNRPELLYEMTAMQALAVADVCRAEGVSIDCLDQFRTEFTRRWFDQKFNEKFPSRLFEWHDLLIELGYFDEYNHWLLAAGDPDGFYTWVEKKPEEFDLFQKWFRVNGMSMR